MTTLFTKAIKPSVLPRYGFMVIGLMIIASPIIFFSTNGEKDLAESKDVHCMLIWDSRSALMFDPWPYGYVPLAIFFTDASVLIRSNADFEGCNSISSPKRGQKEHYFFFQLQEGSIPHFDLSLKEIFRLIDAKNNDVGIYGVDCSHYQIISWNGQHRTVIRIPSNVFVRNNLDVNEVIIDAKDTRNNQDMNEVEYIRNCRRIFNTLSNFCKNHHPQEKVNVSFTCNSDGTIYKAIIRFPHGKSMIKTLPKIPLRFPR